MMEAMPIGDDIRYPVDLWEGALWQETLRPFT